MRTNKLKILTLIICFILLLSGCQSPSLTTPSTIVDRSGNTISLPSEINTIVSLSASNTRILIDLGLGSKIIACDDYSYAYYQNDLNSDIMTFDMMAPDLEALSSLNPSLIFTTGMTSYSGEDYFKTLRQMGIAICDIPTSISIEEIMNDILFIGECVGKKSEAQTIVDEANTRIEEARQIGESISDKKTVLFLLSIPSSDYPAVYSVGGNTFLNEMIEIIGCENVLSSMDSWQNITLEDAISYNPDVIITNDSYTPDPINSIASLPGFENVTAVINNEIYLIDSNNSSEPNHHIVDSIYEMGELIYEDAF